MRFALGLALLALVFIGLGWAWWHMIGRARRTGHVIRTGPQVMIDVALADPASDLAEESLGTSR
jgi:hypothetical protein